MDYPRMLFPGGDTAREFRIVNSAEEEAVAAEEGYREAYSKPDDLPAPTVRRGRPPKVSAP